MSNYCCTSYCFEGDKDCLRDLYERMMRVSSDVSIADYRKRRWMTRLCAAFGFDPGDYYCRGYFDSLDYAEEQSCLSFEVESGNCPCDELIDAIVAFYGGKVSVLWFVECPDDGLFYTNDKQGKYFKNRYEVDLEDIDNEWFVTIPEAIEWIKEKTGVEIPESIASDVDVLYDYITCDLEELTGMCCNFHWVEVVE